MKPLLLFRTQHDKIYQTNLVVLLLYVNRDIVWEYSMPNLDGNGMT